RSLERQVPASRTATSDRRLRISSSIGAERLGSACARGIGERSGDRLVYDAKLDRTVFDDLGAQGDRYRGRGQDTDQRDVADAVAVEIPGYGAGTGLGGVGVEGRVGGREIGPRSEQPRGFGDGAVRGDEREAERVARGRP